MTSRPTYATLPRFPLPPSPTPPETLPCQRAQTPQPGRGAHRTITAPAIWTTDSPFWFGGLLIPAQVEVRQFESINFGWTLWTDSDAAMRGAQAQVARPGLPSGHPPTMTTIDELLTAITEFQTNCRNASLDRQWGQVHAARKALRAWIEEHQLPITFPEEK